MYAETWVYGNSNSSYFSMPSTLTANFKIIITIQCFFSLFCVDTFAKSFQLHHELNSNKNRSLIITSFYGCFCGCCTGSLLQTFNHPTIFNDKTISFYVINKLITFYHSYILWPFIITLKGTRTNLKQNLKYSLHTKF